jgi:DNA adenine methylase
MVKITNVASVPQRSPFRYPGGKTWLVPEIRKWLHQKSTENKILIEPFAGGAIVGLTAAFENLVDKSILIELDEEIAAVWKVIIDGDYSGLAYKIQNFQFSMENIIKELNKENKTLDDIAFNTILKNRTYHGGILANGSGFLKYGENGKGISSRWYPETLKRRILEIGFIRKKLEFSESDAFEIIPRFAKNSNCFFFIDPPYTKAAKRLYNLYEVDHEKLFSLVKTIEGRFLLTYDDTEYIRELAVKHNLQFTTIPMKTTLHYKKNELLISDNLNWLH